MNPSVLWTSALCTLAVLLTNAQSETTAGSVAKVIQLEAEEAELHGVQIVDGELTGFHGTGYAIGLDAPEDRIRWRLPQLAPGMYRVRLRYAAEVPKEYVLAINGKRTTGKLGATNNAFAWHDAGWIELTEGDNVLAIEPGWGYFDVDAISLALEPRPLPPRLPPDRLANPDATPAAQALFARLVKGFGKLTLSGQQSQEEASYVLKQTGHRPAILGGDLMEYSPSRIARGAKPGRHVEEMIEMARGGQIITMCWHWNAPTDLIDQESYLNEEGQTVEAQWWRGFLRQATTFDLPTALNDPDSTGHALLLRDIDAIAVQLRKFADAGVPVLWRPLHEAEQEGFWWAAHGQENFRKLWRLMFERLTKHHRLHNLIWVASNGPDPSWYPGDDVVDIVGVDVYPPDAVDPLSPWWEALRKEYEGRKILALTEFGGVPDIGKMRRHGVYWAYFVSWSGKGGPRVMPPKALKRIYSSEHVRNAVAGKSNESQAVSTQ